MTKVMRPDAKDAVSARRISQTKDDREQQVRDFKEDKEHKQRIKEERFAAIQERRKNRPPSGGSGSSRGINVKVTSDSK